MKNLLQQAGLPGWVVLLMILCSGCALQEEADIKKENNKTGKEGGDFLESLDSKLLHHEAPNWNGKSSYQTGSCCNNNGTSSTVANDPYCFSKFSDGTPNSRWRSINVNQYFVWNHDLLYLYDDGTFRQASASRQTIYCPSNSDFCNNKAAYDFDMNTFLKSGTNDFTPGATRVKFTYTPRSPPVFGKNIYGDEIISSSHNLVINFAVDVRGKWYTVYVRPSKGVTVSEA